MRSLISSEYSAVSTARLIHSPRRINFWHGLLVLTLLLSTTALPLGAHAAPMATTWYVDDTGSTDSDCGTSAKPCQQIRAAIDKSAAGDTISIAPGFYAENLDIPHTLTITGAGVGSTVIDGSNINPVIAIGLNAVNPTVNITGIKFQHGFSAQGGGVYIESGQVTIADSIVFSNTAQSGAGIYLNQGVLRLNNTQLLSNISTQFGGALLNLGQATLTSVQFSGNRAPSGGGIANSTTITLTACTLSNNTATANGGAIYNTGRLIDSGTTVLANQANLNGGGIYNSALGYVTLTASNILSNTSEVGGGVYNLGRAELASITVNYNHATGGNGGGMYSAHGNNPLTINGGTIGHNQASNSGGGMYTDGQTTLTSLSLVSNRAETSGGGIYNTGGQLNLSQANLLNNLAVTGIGGGLFNNTLAQLSTIVAQSNSASSGGGVYNDTNGRLTLTTSQLSSNTATQTGGGGINNRGVLVLTASSIYTNTATVQGAGGLQNGTTGSTSLINVTLSQNAANNGGALVSDGGTVQINNSTLSHNYATGLLIQGGTTILSNTIVALNTSANCSGAIVSGGHNLDSGNSCGLKATGDITGTDPLLGALQNNGGPTPTRSLAIASRAVDAGNNATCASTDQRGIVRPQGDSCDIGAYEVLGFSNTVGGSISPHACLTSTTTINNAFAIGSLHLGVNLGYTPRGDLRIKLYSPSGKVIPVLGATGGLGANLDVLWDDSSPNGLVGDEDHDLTGSFYKYVRVPDSSLHPLFGQNIHGTWKLEICNGGESEGLLNRWTIIVPDIDNFKVFLPVVRRSS